MTLRIETEADGDRTTVRLIGHLKEENLDELAALVRNQTGSVALDLREINLVDVDGIRFLARCDRPGLSLVNCPPYIRSWIVQEKNRDVT